MEYRFYGWEDATIRDARGLTPRDYYDLLRDLWRADTCAPRMRGDWSPDNPTLGQCSITAFLMQDIYGGSVRGVPLGDGNFHCFNAVEGCVFDLTANSSAGESWTIPTALSRTGTATSRRRRSGRGTSD